MTGMDWRTGSPWVRDGVTVAYRDGRLVGAYRRRHRRWIVTYDLWETADIRFGSEHEVRAHLRDRRPA